MMLAAAVLSGAFSMPPRREVAPETEEEIAQRKERERIERERMLRSHQAAIAAAEAKRARKAARKAAEHARRISA